MNTINLIVSDFKKYKKYGGNFFTIVFFTQGFWAIFQYRIASFCYSKITLFPFNFLVKIPLILWQKHIEIITGISIPASAKIGHSFYIGHFGGIIFNANTVIGNNCNVSQGVTIGISGLNNRRGVPSIGNNVYIGANSVIAGKISIGDNVLIGACSLVNRTIEENAVVSGVPVQVISNEGSKGYI
ncbi:serine acetyltransferase [Flavobacterium sp.]|uniref:serine O-acetyltransferase n=1 Tax=Flavobacterium sp. TaxID=239 RepID=UPI00286E74A7|nr:serine acetyltransferase [Flavobacterium sp.]